MDLGEFLLARIAEDEASGSVFADIAFPSGQWGHARVLAECETKRRIVEVHVLVPAADIWGDATEGLSCTVCDERADLVNGGYEQERSDGCPTLRALALPYADHPDYDEAWRP